MDSIEVGSVWVTGPSAEDLTTAVLKQVRSVTKNYVWWSYIHKGKLLPDRHRDTLSLWRMLHTQVSHSKVEHQG